MVFVLKRSLTDQSDESPSCEECAEEEETDHVRAAPLLNRTVELGVKLTRLP